MSADLRLAAPAVAAWLSAAILIGVPGAVLPALTGLWLGCAVALALAQWRRSALALVIALALAAAGLVATVAAVRAPERQPVVVADVAGTGRVVTVTAEALSTVHPGQSRFSARITAIEVAGQSHVLSVPALIFAESAEVIGIGALLELEASLTATDPADARAVLVFATGSPRILGPPPPLLAAVHELREGFLAATRQLPGLGGDLLAGLAIGDTSEVEEHLDAAMKTTALSHLTAVSGANCAVVVGIVMLAGRAAGASRGVRIVASIAVLAGFVLLVTPEPSVLRAAVMALVVLLSVWGGRPARGVPILCVAVLALLLHDPWLARSFGFVLSVAATAGLLLLAGPLARVLGRWLPQWLAVAFAVPIAAQLACQPVIVLLDASLPTYGVVANLLAAPAAPVATVVGLAACLLLAVLPPLGMLAAQLAWLPSAWIAAVATAFAAAPLARLPWPADWWGLGLLALLTTLGLLALFGRGRMRVVTAAALALSCAAYAGIAGGSRLLELAGRPADWQVAACDVGQGDAMLVRSAGQVALIDTGEDPQLLGACLGELGIGRIGLLVLTHFDLDHAGGVDAVLGRVGLVLTGPTDGPGDERTLAALRDHGAQVESVVRGPSGVLGELRWSVLGPPPRRTLEPGNDASVVVHFQPVGRCEPGCLSGLFLGDLGESAQDALLPSLPPGAVDVVKVSHHGSADQSARLYRRLAATAGLIGVGEGNGYGHPTEAALGMLAASGTAALRTDERGMILIAPGEAPGELRVWSQRSPERRADGRGRSRGARLLKAPRPRPQPTS